MTRFKNFIPSLNGKTFLDLGCGFGWYCRWALSEGAVSAKGIEISQNMLAKASVFPRDWAITCLRADLEILELPGETYDIIFSSLTLHYIKRIPEPIEMVARHLKPGGIFRFLSRTSNMDST